MNVNGVIKDQQGDHDTAQFYYREALALQPDNVSISNNLGLSLALSGKGDQAVAVLNDVVDAPDATATSRHNLPLPMPPRRPMPRGKLRRPPRPLRLRSSSPSRRP